MDPLNKKARVAGWWYLAMVLGGPFSLMYVPGKVIVPGNAAATASKVLASEMLFRAGIAGELIGTVIFLCLGIALYRLFEDGNRSYLRAMLAMMAISVAITFANAVNNMAALLLFRGDDFLAALARPEREILGMLFVRLHSQGTFVNEMFWGMWLLPFGMLVIQSRFLPRVLGVLLIVGGVAWIAMSLTWMLAPTYGSVMFKATMPAQLSEIWIMLWLLIKGAKMPQPAAAAA